MKKTIAAVIVAASAVPAFAQGQHWVNPYVTQNGTYVQGHMQTNPDGNVMNNWSTQGNVNPYTGQAGTVNPYQQPRAQMPQMPSFPQVQSPTVCRVNTSGQYVCR